MAGLGYHSGGEGPKLKSVGESLLQKSAHESVAEIDILARIIQQVNSKKTGTRTKSALYLYIHSLKIQTVYKSPCRNVYYSSYGFDPFTTT